MLLKNRRINVYSKLYFRISTVGNFLLLAKCKVEIHAVSESRTGTISGTV